MLVDAVQTASLIVMASALIYVVYRLEQELRRWGRTLAEVRAKLDERQDEPASVQAFETVWGRVRKLERRMKAAERGEPPPQGSMPDDP